MHMYSCDWPIIRSTYLALNFGWSPSFEAHLKTSSKVTNLSSSSSESVVTGPDTEPASSIGSGLLRAWIVLWLLPCKAKWAQTRSSYARVGLVHGSTKMSKIISTPSVDPECGNPHIVPCKVWQRVQVVLPGIHDPSLLGYSVFECTCGYVCVWEREKEYFIWK